MDDVKNGEEEKNLDIGVEGFIDVFDYEYLKTLDSEEEKDTTTFNYSSWEMSYKDEFSTYEDYKETNREIFADYEVLVDNAYELELWDGESYNNVFKLLYNVEIANELGEKLYKKAEITVKEGLVRNKADTDYIDGYEITDIYLR